MKIRPYFQLKKKILKKREREFISNINLVFNSYIYIYFLHHMFIHDFLGKRYLSLHLPKKALKIFTILSLNFGAFLLEENNNK